MSEIVLRREMAESRSAGKLMKLLLAPKGTAGKQEVLDLVKAEPQMALAALQFGDQALGLTPRGSADVLEEVIGAVGDDKSATHLIEQHLTTGRVGELIAARGDLPSAVVEVASIEQILEGIRLEIEGTAASLMEAGVLKSAEDEVDEDDESLEDEEPLEDEVDEDEFPEPAAAKAASTPSDNEVRFLADDPHLHVRALVLFRSWAYKLKDRKDFNEILNRRVFSDSARTFRTYVLYGIWLEAGQPENVEEIPLDAYTALGLEPDEGSSELARLMSGSELSDFDVDPAEWHEAGLAIGRENESKARAPKTVDEIERDKAKEAASKLGF